MNLFIVNGHIATIAACMVAKKFHASEDNILLRETSYSTIHSDRLAGLGQEYHEVGTMLSAWFPWKQVIEIILRRDIFVNEHLAAENVTWANFDQVKAAVRDKVPSLTAKDKLILSDNTTLAQFMERVPCDINVIEHGASMYGRDFFLPFKPKRKLKQLWNATTRRLKSLAIPAAKQYIHEISPQRVYVTDCGMSHAVINRPNSWMRPTITSFCCQDLVAQLFQHFESIYSERFPQDYAEIVRTKQRMALYRHRYLYLPSQPIKPEEYESFLKKQLSTVPRDNAIFLIKFHFPMAGKTVKNREAYASIFDKLDCRNLSIESLRNTYLPAELLMYLLNFPTLFTSCTSSLLYAKWWLNQDPLFAEVVDSPSHEVFKREYAGVYPDFLKIAARTNLTSG